MAELSDMPKRKSGRTELYRHFDKSGALLYVGISLSTAQRMGEHRNGSAWWRKVVSITIERFPTREAALAAERKAVQTEHPAHNVTGRLRGFRTGGSTQLPVEPWRVAVDETMTKFRAEIAARQEAA
jgi:hypothetical protein